MNAPRSGCPINLTLEALGDRWSLIVIRDLMFGNRRHFRELLTRSEERIASNILADRLTRLEKAGLVSRRDDPSHKQKVIYSLTEASIALVPLLHPPPPRDITVRNAGELMNLPCLPSGAGFFSVDGRNLLFITPDGASRVLWPPVGLQPMWAVPAPDGRHLAINVGSGQTNAWMLTDF